MFLSNIIIAESSLELIPPEIVNHPSVLADAKRRKKLPSSILLDKTFHYKAMSGLANKEKRGRPDLVHFAILSVSSTPLYLERKVKLYVHTIDNKAIEIEDGTRLPKHYYRFRGLFEDLLFLGRGGKFLGIRDSGIEALVDSLSSSCVFGLSTLGKQTSLEVLARKILSEKQPCVIVGGFPHGHFSKETNSVLDEIYRIHPKPLESHTVLSWLMYELEKQSKINH
jgi:rRNA small subunit pseudouridine methyltransferase Nep1